MDDVFAYNAPAVAEARALASQRIQCARSWPVRSGSGGRPSRAAPGSTTRHETSSSATTPPATAPQSSRSRGLDLAAARSFLGHLTRASQVSRHVILDLSGLGYMDSTGINALLKARELFAIAGQRIAPAAVPATIRRALNIVAIEEVIPLFPTVDAAINGLRQPPAAH